MNYAQIYFRKKRRLLEKITNFKVLLSALISASILIALIFIFAWSRSKISDSVVQLTDFTPEQLDAKPHVEVSLYINSFSKFEVVENDFIVNITLWFLFEKDAVKESLIEKFSFENFTIVEKSPAIIETTKDGKTLMSYDVRLAGKGNFDYRYYPFDFHRLNLILVYKDYIAEQPIYTTQLKNLHINQGVYTKDWVGTKADARYGTAIQKIDYEGDVKNISYEKMVFSVNLERKSLKPLLVTFLPLFLIFFIGLLSLTFDVLTQFTVILSLSLGSTTALIFYLDSLQKVSPVTDTFTFVDIIYIFLLFIIISTFIFQVIAMNFLSNRQKMTTIPELINETALTINIIRSLLFIFFLLLMLIIVVGTLLF